MFKFVVCCDEPDRLFIKTKMDLWTLVSNHAHATLFDSFNEALRVKNDYFLVTAWSDWNVAAVNTLQPYIFVNSMFVLLYNTCYNKVFLRFFESVPPYNCQTVRDLKHATFFHDRETAEKILKKLVGSEPMVQIVEVLPEVATEKLPCFKYMIRSRAHTFATPEEATTLYGSFAEANAAIMTRVASGGVISWWEVLLVDTNCILTNVPQYIVIFTVNNREKCFLNGGSTKVPVPEQASLYKSHKDAQEALYFYRRNSHDYHPTWSIVKVLNMKS